MMKQFVVSFVALFLLQATNSFADEKITAFGQVHHCRNNGCITIVKGFPFFTYKGSDFYTFAGDDLERALQKVGENTYSFPLILNIKQTKQSVMILGHIDCKSGLLYGEGDIFYESYFLQGKQLQTNTKSFLKPFIVNQNSLMGQLTGFVCYKATKK